MRLSIRLASSVNGESYCWTKSWLAQLTPQLAQPLWMATSDYSCKLTQTKGLWCKQGYKVTCILTNICIDNLICHLSMLLLRKSACLYGLIFETTEPILTGFSQAARRLCKERPTLLLSHKLIKLLKLGAVTQLRYLL